MFISADEQIFIVESFNQTNTSCSIAIRQQGGVSAATFHYSDRFPLRWKTVTEYNLRSRLTGSTMWVVTEFVLNLLNFLGIKFLAFYKKKESVCESLILI